MKGTLTVLRRLGIAAGLGAALVVSSCKPAADTEGANAYADQSTGIPESVAEEIAPLNKRLESDALAEAGVRVNRDDEAAKTFATQGTGIPEEVAEELEAINKRLEADALSEAGLRVRGDNQEGAALQR